MISIESRIDQPSTQSIEYELIVIIWPKYIIIRPMFDSSTIFVEFLHVQIVRRVCKKHRHVFLYFLIISRPDSHSYCNIICLFLLR